MWKDPQVKETQTQAYIAPREGGGGCKKIARGKRGVKIFADLGKIVPPFWVTIRKDQPLNRAYCTHNPSSYATPESLPAAVQAISIAAFANPVLCLLFSDTNVSVFLFKYAPIVRSFPLFVNVNNSNYN